MPTPSASLATLRPDLGASLEEFNLAMDRNGFIGLRILPVIDVAEPSGTFGIIPVESLLQNRDTLRAPGSGYNRQKWAFESSSYATEENGAEDPVDDKEATLYRNYFDAELIATERVRDVVLRNQEKRIADLVFNATTFTGATLTTAIGTEWSDTINSTPLDDVEAALRKVWDLSGFWPRVLIINQHVYRNLRNNAQIIDRISSQGAGGQTRASDINKSALAQVLDLDEVIVASGTKNTALEGQTPVFAEIWSSEYAMLARVASGNDVREPALGRTFHWSADGSEIGAHIESYRDETVRGQIIRARHETAEKLLFTGAGHLLSNITA